MQSPGSDTARLQHYPSLAKTVAVPLKSRLEYRFLQPRGCTGYFPGVNQQAPQVQVVYCLLVAT